MGDSRDANISSCPRVAHLTGTLCASTTSEATPVRQCCERFGVSARAWQRAVAAGLLPPPKQRRLLPSEKRALIDQLFGDGYSQAMIARRFGFCKASWSQAVARGDIIPRPRALPLSELLVRGKKRGRDNLKARLLEAGLKENRCERCGVSEWQGKPLNMQLHHINGDGLDNRLENLELLCANCHSQTSTYGGRNGHRRRRPTGDAEAA
jgi:HNH endonuclease